VNVETNALYRSNCRNFGAAEDYGLSTVAAEGLFFVVVLVPPFWSHGEVVASTMLDYFDGTSSNVIVVTASRPVGRLGRRRHQKAGIEIPRRHSITS
jgi:hypothetical protein